MSTPAHDLQCAALREGRIRARRDRTHRSNARAQRNRRPRRTRTRVRVPHSRYGSRRSDGGRDLLRLLCGEVASRRRHCAVPALRPGARLGVDRGPRSPRESGKCSHGRARGGRRRRGCPSDGPRRRARTRGVDHRRREIRLRPGRVLSGEPTARRRRSSRQQRAAPRTRVESRSSSTRESDCSRFR